MVVTDDFRRWIESITSDCAKTIPNSRTASVSVRRQRSTWKNERTSFRTWVCPIRSFSMCFHHLSDNRSQRCEQKRILAENSAFRNGGGERGSSALPRALSVTHDRTRSRAGSQARSSSHVPSRADSRAPSFMGFDLSSRYGTRASFRAAFTTRDTQALTRYEASLSFAYDNFLRFSSRTVRFSESIF